MKHESQVLPLSLKDRYNTLAIDIGGVVCADVWESIVLTPHIGLAAQNNMDPARALEQGLSIWHRHGHGASTEEAFWQDWEETTGVKFDCGMISSLFEQVVWVDKTAAPLVESCMDAGINVAIISNSNSFWHRILMQRSGLDAFEERMESFLSHELGVSKTHKNGGLARFAATHDVSKTLFVEDREPNIKAAIALGMGTLHYNRDKYGALANVLCV